MHSPIRHLQLAVVVALVSAPAAAQSFRVQCPATTTLHPGTCSRGINAGQDCQSVLDCPGRGATCVPQGNKLNATHPGQIKCQHVGGGDVDVSLRVRAQLEVTLAPTVSSVVQQRRRNRCCRLDGRSDGESPRRSRAANRCPYHMQRFLYQCHPHGFIKIYPEAHYNPSNLYTGL